VYSATEGIDKSCVKLEGVHLMGALPPSYTKEDSPKHQLAKIVPDSAVKVVNYDVKFADPFPGTNEIPFEVNAIAIIPRIFYPK
jgi:hypothetical protein